MSLDCDFGVGLEIVILEKQLQKKPRQVISPGAQRSCFSSSSRNTEHCRIHQELWDFSGVEEPIRVTVSPWGALGLWSHSPGMRLVFHGQFVLDGLAHQFLLIHQTLDQGWICHVDLHGYATGWLPELLNMAMGGVPVSDIRVWMGLEAPHALPLM